MYQYIYRAKGAIKLPSKHYRRTRFALVPAQRSVHPRALWLGLYTIVKLLILYGVWHTKGESRGGGRDCTTRRAIVLQ